ncbi:MAG: winged helix DNA-binding protein [Chakrabartia sp.]
MSELEGEEERLLFELYLLTQQDKAVPMADVYDLLGKKSRSTSYRTLVALREKGLVEFAMDGVDKRKRFVTFTDRAHLVFKAFG